MNQAPRFWDKGFIRFPYIGPIKPHRAGLSPNLQISKSSHTCSPKACPNCPEQQNQGQSWDLNPDSLHPEP